MNEVQVPPIPLREPRLVLRSQVGVARHGRERRVNKSSVSTENRCCRRLLVWKRLQPPGGRQRQLGSRSGRMAMVISVAGPCRRCEQASPALRLLGQLRIRMVPCNVRVQDGLSPDMEPLDAPCHYIQRRNFRDALGRRGWWPYCFWSLLAFGPQDGRALPPPFRLGLLRGSNRRGWPAIGGRIAGGRGPRPGYRPAELAGI